jgi:predicted nicotinamide N-methyase
MSSVRRKPSIRGTIHPPEERQLSKVAQQEGDDDDEDAIVVSLFQREESEFLDVHLSRDYTLPPLRLRQHNSHDHQWGIYSSVWDGGIGMVAWLKHQTKYDQDAYWRRTIVVDLGSGTGIVGLACAAMSKGRAAVHLTDLPDALALLQDNVIRNAHHWERTKHSKMPLVHQLTWGEPISEKWIEEIVSHANSGKRQRVLILGADIVYRVSLFQPLLMTLNEFMSRISQRNGKLEVECILACSSTRTHLNAFWKTARQLQGFAFDWKASVKVPDHLHLDEALVTISPDPHSPPEEAPVESGLVSIVRVRKLPFSFSI